MTLLYVKLIFRVLLHLLKSQKAPASMALAHERDQLETELNDQITKIQYRYQL